MIYIYILGLCNILIITIHIQYKYNIHIQKEVYIFGPDKKPSK